MTKDEFDQLVDSLRYRPVATTAYQMRQAADELERPKHATALSDACE